VVAALLTFLASVRRLFHWHSDWPTHTEAWSLASALISRYRLRPAVQRTEAEQRELVVAIDDLVVEQTRSWGRRRRDLLQPEASGPSV
jgi:hypothetical protein